MSSKCSISHRQKSDSVKTKNTKKAQNRKPKTPFATKCQATKWDAGRTRNHIDLQDMYLLRHSSSIARHYVLHNISQKRSAKKMVQSILQKQAAFTHWFFATFSLVHKNTNIHPCLIAKRLAFASRLSFMIISPLGVVHYRRRLLVIGIIFWPADNLSEVVG